MNNKGVCRTAQPSPGLLITEHGNFGGFYNFLTLLSAIKYFVVALDEVEDQPSHKPSL